MWGEAIFESLTGRLQSIFNDLARRGKLRQRDVRATMKDIRMALLEADVHYDVVKSLVQGIEARIVGTEVSPGLNPAEMVLRAVHEELVRVLGESEPLHLDGERSSVILLVGLQGSGKTTTAAKLAKTLATSNRSVQLVAADLRRPAAVEQLKVLGQRIGVPVYSEFESGAAQVAASGVSRARGTGSDIVIIDSAGRSQLDAELMDEIEAIAAAVDPSETLLVADAMTGQEAVAIAQGFAERVGLTGLILTKMDGDARGGAAISMRSVAGIPIKFVGTGEALDELAPFQPERLATRILGMGDIQSLAEKAQAALSPQDTAQQLARLQQGEFTLADFAAQLDQVSRLGPLGKVMELLPSGMNPGLAGSVDMAQAERRLAQTRAMIGSMTPEERMRPRILNASRRRRIASGSGTSVQEVNQLLQQHRQMQKLFKAMGKRGLEGLIPGLR